MTSPTKNSEISSRDEKIAHTEIDSPESKKLKEIFGKSPTFDNFLEE